MGVLNVLNVRPGAFGAELCCSPCDVSACMLFVLLSCLGGLS
jgi:hypothetical protein